jgi:general L-amino acid transport system permease protein
MNVPPPEDVDLFRDDARAVEVAPQREPQTPWEWIRDNLFASPFSGVLTIVFGSLGVWLIYSVTRWVFVNADWDVIRANLRPYMAGRFPPDKLWAIWASLYLIALLVGVSWGVGRKRLRWTWRMITLRVGILALALIALNAILEGLRIWAWIGIAVGLLFGGVVAGRALTRRFPTRARTWVLVAWILAFPAVMIIIRGIADVRPVLWGGFFLNVVLAFVAIFASFPLGILLALGRRSTLQVISKMSVLFIEVIRGVPLFTLLIFGQFVLPLLLPRGLELAAIVRAMIMFTIFSAAYVAEIVRGGLQGVPQGQYEAARALALPTWRMNALIVLPQALRNTIPAMISHFISLFKDTTLIAGIGLLDMLAVARRAPRLAFSGDVYEALLTAALFFWIVAFSMSRWSQRLEKRLGVGER